MTTSNPQDGFKIQQNEDEVENDVEMEMVGRSIRDRRGYNVVNDDDDDEDDDVDDNVDEEEEDVNDEIEVILLKSSHEDVNVVDDSDEVDTIWGDTVVRATVGSYCLIALGFHITSYTSYHVCVLMMMMLLMISLYII